MGILSHWVSYVASLEPCFLSIKALCGLFPPSPQVLPTQPGSLWGTVFMSRVGKETFLGHILFSEGL